MRTRVFVLAAAAGAAMAVTAPAAANAEPTGGHVAVKASDPVQAQASKKFNGKCKTPKGKKITVSFSPGNLSTTFKFTNRCKQKRAIQVWKQTNGGEKKKGKCFVVNKETKGKKKVWDSMATPYKVTFPKKIPKHCEKPPTS
ncbi:hypothetical protein [Actinomadura fibrosa]|uniref:Uncharacterized protein n=1 Tax=Actinomadura fibrosa TaxID=111802 RepID=A0ABW2XMY6_9ACTN|nr:hypothetical protein [Actinomadura fibrosa]